VFIAIEMRLNENSHYSYSSVIFQKMCHVSCAERHISSFLTEYLFSVMSILQICLRIQKPVSKFYQMPSWNGRWGNFSTFFVSMYPHVYFPLIFGVYCTVFPIIQKKSGIDSFSVVNTLHTNYFCLFVIGDGCDNA
jgi:hypothetical protein